MGASTSWLPVQVPCVEMLPIGCLLWCVARGTPVGVVSCGEGYPSLQNETIRGRIDYCRWLLQSLGDPTKMVTLGRIDDRSIWEEPAGDTGPAKHRDIAIAAPMFGPEATAQTLRTLAEGYGKTETPPLKHPHSPVGVVEVEPQQCTGYGVCAGACPTRALQFLRDDGDVVLTLDGSTCIACGQCIKVCPEADAGAIRLDRATDLAHLIRGQTTVYRDKEARCERCGAPIASIAMLNRIASMAGEELSPLMVQISRYCPDCRGLG